jgi:HPt (histidine-containing phosphotransfer) domain-containing protein
MSDEINVEAFMQVKELMGDKFQGLVETYVRSNREHVAKLRQGLEESDAQKIVDSAHPMKSSAGNMGLAGLSESARELEVLAKEVVSGDRDTASLAGLISTIEEQFERGVAFLEGD